MNFIERYRYNKKMQEDERILDDELIEILKRDLKDENLTCFRFMDIEQIKEIIQRNYKNVNNRTLGFTAIRIVLNQFTDDFCHYKEFKDKTDFEEIVKEMNKKEG